MHRLRGVLARLVPSVRALLLAAAAICVVTLAAVVDVTVVSGEVRVTLIPTGLWQRAIVVGVVMIFALMLLGTWLHGRWVRRRRAKQGATEKYERSRNRLDRQGTEENCSS